MLGTNLFSALSAIVLAMATMPLAAGVAMQSDPLTPTSAVDPAAVSPLRAITILSGDMAATRRFYATAMTMRAAPVARLDRATARYLRVVPTSETLGFARRGAADVRIVGIGAGAVMRRPSHDAFAIGGLAMGVAVRGQARREAIVTRAGFGSAVGITSMTLAGGDGRPYVVEEIHYRAPDGVLVLGIDRGAMRPVGPIDAASGISGPAYSSIVVADLPRSEAFLRDVLRYEKRRGFTFTSAGTQGGLGLPDGARITLQQWFAPGASSGYVILLKLLDQPDPPPPLPGPMRGLAMWSFDAADIDAVAVRARAAGIRIVSAPTRGARRSTTLEMPDGFLVEITQAKGPVS